MIGLGLPFSAQWREMLRIWQGLPFSVNDAIYIYIYWAGPPVFGPMTMQWVGLGFPSSVNDDILGWASRFRSNDDAVGWARLPVFSQ